MGKARFEYTKRNEPIVHEFTERQKAILGGYSISPPTRRELTNIIKKAKLLGKEGVEESLFSLYEDMFLSEPDNKSTSSSLEELRKRLQRLTPWEIQWKELSKPMYHDRT